VNVRGRSADGLRLRFVIVGTPRSGTTLIQRLSNELPEVHVPIETHFFRLGHMFLSRRRYPMRESALRAALSEYSALPALREAEFDIDLVVQRLRGVAFTPFEIFEAVVVDLADPAVCSILGEKTPAHLRYWKALARGLPELKFVAVVRDPRAVYNSHCKLASWGLKDARALSKVWTADQRQLLEAADTLGPQRFLTLRYEDVVQDADRARAALAKFLGVPQASLRELRPSSSPLEHSFLPWERPWKEGSLQPISSDRASAWRADVDDGIDSTVTAICGPEMRRLGYSFAPNRSLPHRLKRRGIARLRAHQLMFQRELRALLVGRSASVGSRPGSRGRKCV
jgi:hypothetical protein